jgi:chaperonin GroEL
MDRVYTNIVPKEKVRFAQAEALEIISDTLVNSYGPNGSTTAIRRGRELTKYTKDGHTILQNIIFTRPIEQTMRDDLEDITRRIVTTVGDGTTSACMLSNLFFTGLFNAHKNLDISELKLVKMFQDAIKNVIKVIDSNKKDTTIDDIYNIAMISTNGNEEVATNIKNIYEKLGMNVFIDVGISNSVDNVLKIYDGLTFDSGYSDPAFITDAAKKVSSIANPKIYVFIDPIDTPEMRKFLDKILYDNIYTPLTKGDMEHVVPTVIFCPKLSEDMNAMMEGMIKQMASVPAENRPPLSLVTNIYKMDLLDDLATLSGAKVIKKYIDPKNQEIDIAQGLAATMENLHEFAGTADLVVSDNSKTKVINPKCMHNEDGTKSDIYNELLSGLEAMLENYEETKEELTKIGLLKRRINSLKANMVDYLVGGISMTDRDALRDLVEDAVLNCRSAAQDGVGYGANFEGLRAFDQLSGNLIKLNNIDEVAKKTTDGKYFNIYNLLAMAYFELTAQLYLTYCDNDKDKAYSIVRESLNKGCPMNIRTGEFDNTVLSSIKSEEIILDAISKIIGMVFTTNQYLCGDPINNVYVEK